MDMSAEDQARMESAMTAVQLQLGSASPVLERDIKDALWNYYFDVDESVAYLRAKNKLAAKIAAAKAAKLAAVAPAAAAASLPAPGADPSVPEGGKKLSKLQLKMLASQAARKAPSVPTPPPRAPTPPPTALPTLPPSPPSAPAFSLRAPPSHFASTLAPASPAPLDLLARIERALGRDSAIASAGIPAFAGPSPDDLVLLARKGTSLGVAPKRISQTEKGRREIPTAVRETLARVDTHARQDLEGMNLVPAASTSSATASSSSSVGGADTPPPPPVTKVAKEKILEEVRRKEKDEKPVLSLVVVGHVDAGKSTLMGRLLHELGVLSDRALQANQRQAQKIGKASFAYAWTLDATDEERERGVTIGIAIDGFETASKRFTLIDAPGHRDFIPNMISGAAQADTAVLVIDGSNGGFERGFEGNGQTREHAVLVRSLGVQQLVVAINKLDAVRWAEARFENIKALLIPFLSQTGFHPSKVFFVPVGATTGENVVARESEILNSWYDGPTLVEQLDKLDVPPRSLEAPLRIPVSNVFRGQSATASGLAVSGRIESGIVQVGEELAALPGDGVGVVRSLEVDGVLVPYAVAGVNATVFLSGIDPRNLSVGSVLCPIDQLVPVVSGFSAQIIVFDLDYPIPAGASVELFHHSKDIPATISSLDAVLDKVSGAVIKTKPRMLTKSTSARIHVQLRNPTSGPPRKAEMPLETFATNKSMGRVLFRRGGITIAAGIVLEVLP
ncbi:hypothetical protein RQP46_006412 [Phenoliferia psychrophenolica]